LCKSDAGLESGDTRVVELVRFDRDVRKCLRKKQVRCQVQELKAPRHHSDYLTGDEIDENHATKHVSVAGEPSLPVSERQNHSSRTVRPFVLLREPSA